METPQNPCTVFGLYTEGMIFTSTLLSSSVASASRLSRVMPVAVSSGAPAAGADSDKPPGDDDEDNNDESVFRGFTGSQ